MPDDEFFLETLKYYGLEEDDARQLLEHGLMYSYLQTQQNAELEKWKPYGANEKPAAEKAAKTKPSAAKFDLNLGDLL